MASRGSGRTGGSNGSSGHNSKPYARPESSSKRSLRQQDRSLLGGLFSRAKSLFSLGSSAPPELQPPAATQTESNGSMPAPQVPHRLAGTYTLAGSSSRVPARTSARGTTPIAMLQISPEKANNPFKNDTEGLQNGTLHGLSRQQSPFRSPSLTALRLRSPSPERAQSPQRPGSVILNSRGSSPYRRPLERPGSPANASTLISDRRLQRDSSLISNQSHRSGIVRSASIASFADHTPRKRQMLWDPQHGFVAASTERDPSQELQPSNEAERILSQLESMSGLPHRQRAKSPLVRSQSVTSTLSGSPYGRRRPLRTDNSTNSSRLRELLYQQEAEEYARPSRHSSRQPSAADSASMGVDTTMELEEPSVDAAPIETPRRSTRQAQKRKAAEPQLEATSPKTSKPRSNKTRSSKRKEKEQPSSPVKTAAVQTESPVSKPKEEDAIPARPAKVVQIQETDKGVSKRAKRSSRGLLSAPDSDEEDRENPEWKGVTKSLDDGAGKLPPLKLPKGFQFSFQPQPEQPEPNTLPSTSKSKKETSFAKSTDEETVTPAPTSAAGPSTTSTGPSPFKMPEAPSSAPTFSFGEPAKTSEAAASTSTSSPFNFAAPPAQSTSDVQPSLHAPATEVAKQSDAPPPPPAEAETVAKPAASSVFNFGAPAPSQKTEAEATATEKTETNPPKSPFSFASAPTPQPTSEPSKASPFSFQPPENKTAPATNDKPAFSFGSAPSSSAPSPALGSTANLFNFGQPPPVSSNSAQNPTTPATEVSKPAFSFAAPTPASSEASKPAAFSFGVPASQPQTSSAITSSQATPSKPAFSFTAPSPQVTETGAPSPSPFQTASSPFNFGASKSPSPALESKPALPVSNPAPTSPFGAPTSSAPSSNGFSFGAGSSASTNSSTPAFTFGSSQPAPAFGSGSAASTPSPFGAASSAPAAGTATTNGFGNAFGSTSSSAFGASAHQQSSASAFGSQPAQQQQPSNSGFAFTFGSSAPATSSSSTAAPFQFGAPSNTSSASSPFQFGASTAPVGNNGFAFGSSSVNGGSGATTPTGTAPPGAGSLFNIGAGDPPKSPANRPMRKLPTRGRRGQ